MQYIALPEKIEDIETLAREVDYRLGEMAQQFDASRIGITVPRGHTDSGEPVHLTVQEVLLPLMGRSTPTSTAKLIDAEDVLGGDTWIDLTDGGECTVHHHDARYVNITGDTMTGALTISNNLTVTGNITMSDSKWIGLSATTGRILFGYGANNHTRFEDANLILDSTWKFYFRDETAWLKAGNAGYLEFQGTEFDVIGDLRLKGEYKFYTLDSGTSYIWSDDANYIDYVAGTGHRFAGAVTMDSGLDVTGSVTATGTSTFANVQVPNGGFIQTTGDVGWVFNSTPAPSQVQLDPGGEAAAALMIGGGQKIFFEASGTTQGGEYITSGAADYLDIHFTDDDKGCRFYSGANALLTLSRQSAGLPTNLKVTSLTTTRYYVGATYIYGYTTAEIFPQLPVALAADNLELRLGGGRDAKLYYNATNLIIDPDAVGTGKVYIGATADDDIVANAFMTTTAGTESVQSDAAGYMDYAAATAHRFNGYVVLGANSTGHSLSATGDLLISDDLEVDGTTWFDGASYVWMTTAGTNGIFFREATLTRAFFGADGTRDQFLFGLGGEFGRQCVMCDSAYWGRDFDHAGQANPTLYIHSATDPNTANTQWLSLTHDQTNALVEVGAGGLNLNCNVILGGGQVVDQVTKSAAYTATAGDYVILCDTDTAGAPFTITLPAAASHAGRIYYIKNTGTSADDVTVDGNGAEEIDHAATQAVTDGNCLEIVCDGTGWWSI